MTITARSVLPEDLPVLYASARDSMSWPVPFVLPSWLTTWWQVYRREKQGFVRAFYSDGQIIGIAPLTSNGTMATFLGNTDVCDYQDFIIAEGAQERFFSALIDEITDNEITTLNLAHVRPDSSVVTSFIPYCTTKGYSVDLKTEDVSAEMPLPPQFETYLENLEGKQRHEVRRKMRKFVQAGDVKYVIAQDEKNVPAALDDFLKMFVNSRDDKAQFLNDDNERFFREIAAALTKAGLFRIGSLYLDNQPVAAVIFFDYSGRRYLYNSGYDPAYTSLSAGLVSKLMTIEDAIQQKLSVFDFLKGSETYKYQLGGIEVPLSRCTITIG